MLLTKPTSMTQAPIPNTRCKDELRLSRIAFSTRSAVSGAEGKASASCSRKAVVASGLMMVCGSRNPLPSGPSSQLATLSGRPDCNPVTKRSTRMLPKTALPRVLPIERQNWFSDVATPSSRNSTAL